MSLQPPQSIADWLIWGISILAMAAIAWVAVTYLGIPIPQWVVTILTILLLAVVAIWAIRAVSRA